MIVVGLTGGIATGKSTTADLFRERGIAVFDADRSVHNHMSGTGPAVAEICAIFGEEVLREDGSIDRNLLGHYVFRNEVSRQKLEQIIHPLVARERAAFLARQRQDGARMVLLDVPLLFETGADDLCDLVVVTTVPAEIQHERALARDGMTVEKLTGILNSQMSLSEKVDRADFVLDTGTNLATTRQQLFVWLDQILD